MEVETTTNRAETRASKRKREEEIEKQQKKIKRLTKAVEQLSRDLGRGKLTDTSCICVGNSFFSNLLQVFPQS